MRRVVTVVAGVAAALCLVPDAAHAQPVEIIHRYEVGLQIQSNGTLMVTERIDYDFGSASRHGIFRDVPTRLFYDDTRDRIYPLEVLSVGASRGAPAEYTVEQIEGGKTRIRIGDPDREITGRHVYTIAYRVEAAMNAFDDHDELYWNAIGPEWPVGIERASVVVAAPSKISRWACFSGYEGSQLGCEKADAEGDRATFRQRHLLPGEGLTVVVALPKGVVSQPRPILEERWSLARAFEATPWTVSASVGLLALGLCAVVALAWRGGRDRLFLGSPVDQVMGGADGADRAVPLLDADTAAPVEFAPPDDLRPGQIGTLVDERANTLDVTATIVDLATRGYLQIREEPKEGWFSKQDWTLIRLGLSKQELAAYERTLLSGLFRDGDEVRLSELRKTFAERLEKVEEELYADAVKQGWFVARPDRVRRTWQRWGLLLTVAGGGLTYLLARWTHWGLIGIAVPVVGLALMTAARWMPSRTAKGTATLRRVRGFRTVIEKAETHMSRWAEQENVFTRYLPYAIVFGCTEKWAKAFDDIGAPPQDTSWYVAGRPFAYGHFGHAMDSFTVTTSGTISSTPSGSGSSGFGGGGSSGGGGGGGGGGSW
jgi:uncharacterized protein (TIGR04222 family)